VSCVSETSKKYEVAPRPSPVQHFEFYIWLNLNELRFERRFTLKRGIVLDTSCPGYQGKDSRQDLVAHTPVPFTALQSYCIRVCW